MQQYNVHLYYYSGWHSCILLSPSQVVTDCQLLKVPLPLCVRTATLTKYCCPTSRPVMVSGEEEGVLGCVVGEEVVLPYWMVYCGLVSPHRSAGGDQVTLTAPRVVNGSSETIRGALTAARELACFLLLYTEIIHVNACVLANGVHVLKKIVTDFGMNMNTTCISISGSRTNGSTEILVITWPRGRWLIYDMRSQSAREW